MSESNQTLKIIALVPAYNEGPRVAEVVKLSKQYLPVLVIDDGSRDNSGEYAREAGAQVVRQEPNQGKGAALINGYRRALAMGCDAVVMLDADLQHDPHEIPLFLEAFRSTGADLVIGVRDFSKMPQPRRTTNTFGTWSFSWAVGQHVPDNQSGYRLLSRRMMEATLESRETNFEFEVEMIVICIQRGYQLSWVPIKTIYGDEKSHIRPLRHIYHFFRVLFQAWRRMRKGRK